MKFLLFFLFFNLVSAQFAKLNIFSHSFYTQILIEPKSWPKDVLGLQVFKTVNGQERLISDSLHLPYFTKSKRLESVLYPEETIQTLNNIVKQKLKLGIIEEFTKASSLVSLQNAHPFQLKGERMRSKMDFDRARLLGWGLVDQENYKPNTDFILKAVYENGSVKTIHNAPSIPPLNKGWSKTIKVAQRIFKDGEKNRELKIEWKYSAKLMQDYGIDGFWLEVYKKEKLIHFSEVAFRGRVDKKDSSMINFDHWIKNLDVGNEYELKLIPHLKFGKSKLFFTQQLNTKENYFKNIYIERFGVGNFNKDLSVFNLNWKVFWPKYFIHVKKQELYYRSIGDSIWMLLRSNPKPFNQISLRDSKWAQKHLLNGNGIEVKIKLYSNLSWVKDAKEFVFKIDKTKWKSIYNKYYGETPKKVLAKSIKKPIDILEGIWWSSHQDLGLKAEVGMRNRDDNWKNENEKFLKISWNDSLYKKKKYIIRINGDHTIITPTDSPVLLDYFENTDSLSKFLSIAPYGNSKQPAIFDSISISIPPMKQPQHAKSLILSKKRVGNSFDFYFKCDLKYVTEYQFIREKNNKIDSIYSIKPTNDSICIFNGPKIKEANGSEFLYFREVYSHGFISEVQKIRNQISYLIETIDLPILSNVKYKKRGHLAYLEFDYSDFKPNEKYGSYKIQLRSKTGRIIQSKELTYSKIIKNNVLTLGWLNGKTMPSDDYTLEFYAPTGNSTIKTNVSKVKVYVPNAKLPTIKDFGYEVLEKGKIRLSWNYPNDLKELGTLTLEYDDKSINVKDENGSFIIDGLKAKQEYQFVLRATSNMKTGESISSPVLFIYN